MAYLNQICIVLIASPLSLKKKKKNETTHFKGVPSH